MMEQTEDLYHDDSMEEYSFVEEDPQKDPMEGVRRLLGRNLENVSASLFAPDHSSMTLTPEEEGWALDIKEYVEAEGSGLEHLSDFEYAVHAIRADYDLEEAVERSAVLHATHIATGGDPFETGNSRPLDFGHWSAHKLEQLTNFELSHAEAVSVGFDAALHAAFFGRGEVTPDHVVIHLAGTVVKDEPKDVGALRTYWDVAVKPRARKEVGRWKAFFRARKHLGEKSVQGNLDPLALMAGPEATISRTKAILDAAGGTGHIMNLGHGILPKTPLESVDAFVETVRNWKAP